MRDPKNTDVVTQNTSDKEEEAAAIIADAGSHWVKQRRDDCGKSTETVDPGKFQL